MSIYQDTVELKKMFEQGVMPYSPDENLISHETLAGTSLKNKPIETDVDEAEEIIFKAASADNLFNRGMGGDDTVSLYNDGIVVAVVRNERLIKYYLRAIRRKYFIPLSKEEISKINVLPTDINRKFFKSSDKEAKAVIALPIKMFKLVNEAEEANPIFKTASKENLAKRKEQRELRRYYFSITLNGVGFDPDEAWEEALEGFAQDPGGFGPDEITKSVKVDPDTFEDLPERKI